MDWLKQFVLNWVLEMVNGFDSHIATAVSVLTTDVFSGSIYSMAQSIQSVVQPIALVIISLCFFIEFLRLTITMDIIKPEFFFRVFFKLAIAKAAIEVSFTLLSAIYATGSEWITSVGNVGSTLGSQVGLALSNILSSLNDFQALGLVITMGMAFFAVWVSGMMVIVIAYARMFELVIYLAISPLPCALLPAEGSRITKKYFLSFASVCLQGLFIIVSIRLFQAVCSDSIIKAVQSASALSDIAFNMLLGALVLVVAVVKSGSWAKAILDVA